MLDPLQRNGLAYNNVGRAGAKEVRLKDEDGRIASACLKCRMLDVVIRPATRSDLPRLTEIYNYYVLNTPITFDIEPYTVEKRAAWFEQFGGTGRHRLLVAEENGVVLGYAGTMRWRPKAAYDTTAETTIYCAPESTGKGLGLGLYSALFETLREEDVHRIVAGYTLPNAGSAALHKRLGFREVGVFTQVGRKFGKYWNVAWMERPVRIET